MNYLLLLVFLFFSFKRLLTYLHIYQQEEYDARRFTRWIVSSRSFDVRLTAVVLVVSVLEWMVGVSYNASALIFAATALLLSFLEPDPRKASKKKLVLTGRARRILSLAFVIMAAFAATLAISKAPLLTWVIAIHAIPFSLAFANVLLSPYEKRVQQGFWDEAYAKLQSQKPVVIGITGSYGKTSTKHLLGHILELQAPTLITPGSINTPMGIARIVREQLSPRHRFFVCEMGAYGPGSIERLCRLAPPDIGVITAIGKAHYERFKSLDTVAAAKFELAQAVALRNGTTVLYEQVLSFPAARNFLDRPNVKTAVVGFDLSADLRIQDSAQTSAGIRAEVEWRGKTYSLRAPIFGEHHVANMAVAFATACAVGVRPDDAVVALASTPQIAHRLEVKEGLAHSRLIDDAYNSNPVGFASALKLLGSLQKDGGRRILVTPGMVEMGSAHDEEHKNIGDLAASFVDVLLPVLPERIRSFTDAYLARKLNGVVVPCASFSAAQAWLETNVRSNDVVLLENDLPDVYERKLRL